MRATMWVRSGVVAAALSTVLAACSDSPTMPREEFGKSRWAVTPALSVAYSGDTSIATFVVDPDVRSLNDLGRGHQIGFPAHSICDPAVSTYGTTEWDNPCEPLTTPLAIEIKSWRTESGHARVEFSPELRFVPDAGADSLIPPQPEDFMASETGAVVLYLKDVTAASTGWLDILWCGPTGTCVDESVNDAGAKTWYDGFDGYVYRRVKHFSGYNISVGRALTVSIE
jgi:hypothetical protein